ncbi:MAG: hypothetical protein RIM99_11950 [Cyclobacteriaceae bacterium]
MNNSGFFLLILVALSCRPGQKSPAMHDLPLINGTTDPIVMDTERTVIPMSDYVSDPFRIDSVTTDGPFAMEIDNSNILLYGRPDRSLYLMSFWSKGIAESVLIRPVKKSLHSFLYDKKAKGVRIIGDFNNWDIEGTIMKRSRNAFTSYLLLSPGKYSYRFVVDGKEVTDPFAQDSIRDESGIWTSVLTISEKIGRPDMKIRSQTSEKLGIGISELPEKIYVLWQNTRLTDFIVKSDEKEIEIDIPLNARKIDFSTIRIWVENRKGVTTELKIPLYFGETQNGEEK